MTRRHLRIYRDRDAAPSPPATTRIVLRDLLPLLDQARRRDATWLRDFLDDEVLVTADLFEVLQASRAIRPTG